MDLPDSLLSFLEEMSRVNVKKLKDKEKILTKFMSYARPSVSFVTLGKTIHQSLENTMKGISMRMRSSAGYLSNEVPSVICYYDYLLGLLNLMLIRLTLSHENIKKYRDTMKKLVESQPRGVRAKKPMKLVLEQYLRGISESSTEENGMATDLLIELHDAMEPADIPICDFDANRADPKTITITEHLGDGGDDDYTSMDLFKELVDDGLGAPLQPHEAEDDEMGAIQTSSMVDFGLSTRGLTPQISPGPNLFVGSDFGERTGGEPTSRFLDVPHSGITGRSPSPYDEGIIGMSSVERPPSEIRGGTADAPQDPGLETGQDLRDLIVEGDEEGILPEAGRSPSFEFGEPIPDPPAAPRVARRPVRDENLQIPAALFRARLRAPINLDLAHAQYSARAIQDFLRKAGDYRDARSLLAHPAPNENLGQELGAFIRSLQDLQLRNRNLHVPAPDVGIEDPVLEPNLVPPRIAGEEPSEEAVLQVEDDLPHPISPQTVSDTVNQTRPLPGVNIPRIRMSFVPDIEITSYPPDARSHFREDISPDATILGALDVPIEAQGASVGPRPSQPLREGDADYTEMAQQPSDWEQDDEDIGLGPALEDNDDIAGSNRMEAGIQPTENIREPSVDSRSSVSEDVETKTLRYYDEILRAMRFHAKYLKQGGKSFPYLALRDLPVYRVCLQRELPDVLRYLLILMNNRKVFLYQRSPTLPNVTDYDDFEPVFNEEAPEHIFIFLRK